jgi:hypothetical protein
MFLSRKILKPDVPPKRYGSKPRLLRAWITQLFFPPRYLLPVRNAIAKEGSPSQRKVFRRNRP